MTMSLFDLPPTPNPAARQTVAARTPEHVKRILEAKGLRDPDTGATRKARQRRCPTCHRTVWRGIDRDFGGMSVDCDRTVLTAAGETAAILAGLCTYDLAYGVTPTGYAYVLERRNATHIRSFPAAKSGMDVLPEHSHQPRSFDTAPTQIKQPVATVLGDVPPF